MASPVLVQLSTVHPRTDTRIREKICGSLAAAHPGAVHLVVADGLGPEVSRGVTVHDVGKPPLGRPGRFLLGSARAWRLVRALRPSVVHFHDPELLPLGVLLQRGGCPVIYDVHEDYQGVIGTRRWLPRAVRGPVARLFARMESAASRRLAAVVAATPPIARLFPEGRTVLVQNFPRAQEFASLEGAADAQDGRTFLYVGAITERRGVDTMVRALEATRSDARLVLAGSFRPATLRAEMEGLPGWGRVRFDGWADRATVGRLMAEASAGLVVFKESPNQPESQPNKLFEYMLCALPVIASDFPYWRSLVGADDACLFVDPEDPRDLAAAMDWVVANPAEAAEMGRRGRQAVLQRFTWASEEVRLLDLYQRLLAAPRRAD